MSKIEFLKESIKNLKTVGTVTRSSKYICKAMIKPVNFQDANIIVELGAGDGVITKHILASMKPDATLLAFEVNKKFCEKIRQINDPRLHVIEDTAEKLGEYLAKHQFEKADYIISAIPFVSLPDDLGLRIVKECHTYLKDGGLFVQLHYSLLVKKLYQSVFGNVDVSFEPKNIPPAFILTSTKK